MIITTGLLGRNVIGDVVRLLIFFNAKYANYLRDCYNQFPWSLLFLLNWSI